MTNISKKSVNFWKIATFFVSIVFMATQLFNRSIHLNLGQMFDNFQVVSTVSANEIYPMFTCPCCGQPLNKEEPCCESMIQMINFIDGQVELDKSKEEIILSTAKEFGIERLTNEQDRINLREQLIASAPVNSPKIELSETEKDLGTVSQKDGVVSYDFKFVNSGKTDLVINKLSSSCGCTSGAIVYENNVGPKFTMEGHGQNNPTDWSVSIKPGNSAILRVYYDPSVHPDLEGYITRTVSVFSNDPVDFEVKITITLEQTK